MRRTTLVNYTLYQVGWLACVLGAAWQHPWLGSAIALLLVGAHLALSRERGLELRLVALALAVGLVFETIQIRSGTYRFSGGAVWDGTVPVWLAIVWAQFATTFRFTLHAVVTRLGRAVVFGALGGPAAFVAGDRLGALTLLPPIGLGLLRLSIAWAVAMVVFSIAARRTLPAHEASRYRNVRFGRDARERADTSPSDRRSS